MYLCIISRCELARINWLCLGDLLIALQETTPKPQRCTRNPASNCKAMKSTKLRRSIFRG